MKNPAQIVKKSLNLNSKLSYIFKEQPSLAWDMMQQQCNIYTSPELNVQQVNKLSSYYCKIVQKLNCLQDSRQKYFINKMRKLMAQPFIIRAYNNFAQKKQNNQLDLKRKQLQLKLSMQTQRQNSQTFQHILNAQTQKQKKLQSKIAQVLTEHQKKLQNRLHNRQMKSLTSPKKKNSLEQNLLIKNQEPKNPEKLQLRYSSCIPQIDYQQKQQKKKKFFYLDQSDSSEDEYNIQLLILEEKKKGKVVQK